MSAVAVLLGALPSFGNSFLSTTVGFITEATGDESSFFKVILSLYVAAAVANVLQERFDEHFDAKFGVRVAYSVRIVVPALLLAALFVCVGELLARPAALGTPLSPIGQLCFLLCVAAIGFCTGCLSSSGATIASHIQVRSVILVWVGVACAGLSCVAAVYLLGFNPEADAWRVRMFFASGSALVAMCLLALWGLHCSGGFSEAYQQAAEYDAQWSPEGMTLTPGKQDVHTWSSWLQGGNAGITVFCFPLLPFLHSKQFAQELVLWKLCMDFLGPLLLMLAPHDWPLHIALSLLAARAVLLASVLSFLGLSFGAADYKISLVVAWGLLMLSGAMLSCILDTSTLGSALWRRRFRRNRFSQNIGIIMGMLSSGTVLYLFVMHAGTGSTQLPAAFQRKWSTSSSCPQCVEADAQHRKLERLPCGVLPTAVAGERVARVFHFGANMGCAKLRALNVTPVSAVQARIVGRCLRFASAEGVPTSDTEPSFGTLTPCGGCVHGIVHTVVESHLRKISATEAGYDLVDMPRVVSYEGEALSGVKAYVMREQITLKPPSRRYAGLIYCQASASLAAAYADQVSCHFGELGIHGLNCQNESFVPLAALGKN